MAHQPVATVGGRAHAGRVSRPRLLEPVYAVSASKLLLQTHVPHELSTALNNVARKLAWQVLARISPDDQSDSDQ